MRARPLATGATRARPNWLTATAAEIDARPDEHDVPEHAAAVAQAPDYLPPIEVTSDCNASRHAEELGFEPVVHGPCGRSNSAEESSRSGGALDAHPRFGIVMLVPQHYGRKPFFMPNSLQSKWFFSNQEKRAGAKKRKRGPNCTESL